MSDRKETESAATPAPARLRLFTEYEKPMGQLLSQAIKVFREAEFPLLRDLEISRVDHFPPSAPVGRGFSLGATTTKAEAATSNDDFLNTNVEAWATLAYEIGTQFGREMARHITETMIAVTQKTGNVVSAGGKPLSHDLILDTIERTEFDLDDAGNPKNLVLLGPPQIQKQLASLPPMTPEQEERFQSILQKKREEKDAKKRFRTMDT
jgi:hypothetical protein